MIEVRGGPEAFDVTLGEGAGSTVHAVTLSEGYLEKVGLAGADRGVVVEESFRFLLEREPKESILGEFDLSVIERYFPSFPEEIRRRLVGRQA